MVQEAKTDNKILSDKRSEESRRRDKETNKAVTYEEGSAFPNEGFNVRGPYVENPIVNEGIGWPGPSRRGINPIGADKRAMLKQQLEGQNTDEPPADIVVSGLGQIVYEDQLLEPEEFKGGNPKASQLPADREREEREKRQKEETDKGKKT